MAWEGAAASADDCARAVAATRAAFLAWSEVSTDTRIAALQRYAAVIGERQPVIAEASRCTL